MAAFARLKRTVAVLAATVVAFCAYHVVAVPFIEPAFQQPDGVIIEPPIPYLPRQPLTPYFAPGSWELDNPIVLESDRSKLLFKEYKNLDNGRVQLMPCAILFFPNGETAGDGPPRGIALEAPKGALLQFDGPVDLDRMKLGQLQSGVLHGPITIHGNPSRPGANDELFADTPGELQMTPEKIWTEAPVNIRFGPNEGHGRQLEIRLAASDKPANKQQRGPNVGAVQSLEVLHDVQMRFIPGRAGMMPLDGQREAAHGNQPPAASTRDLSLNRAGPRPIADVAATGHASANGASTSPSGGPSVPPVPQPPVDVRCQGPFVFDIPKNTATFQDAVDVRRVFPGGATDRMTCDWMSITFAARRSSAVGSTAATAKPAELQTAAPNSPVAAAPKSGLEPRRLEAGGKPVLLRAESNGAYVRAEHLSYDIATGRVIVDDPQEAVLRQLLNEIHGKSVDYEPGEAGRLGRLEAPGPGWLRAAQHGDDGQAAVIGAAQQLAPTGVTQLGLPVAPNHQITRSPARGFEAHWSGMLKMRPHDGEHVVSLIGDARAGFTDQGELSADEIHLWLKELPSTQMPQPGEPTRRWQVVLDRMVARPSPERTDGHPVNINSPQLSGKTQLLEAWFEQAPAAAAAIPQQRLFGPSAFGPTVNLQAVNGAPAAGNPFIIRPAGNGPPTGSMTLQANGPPGKPPQQYHVEGDRVRLQMLTAGSHTDIQNVTIDGHAQFGQTPTSQQPEPPLLVKGDQIEVLRADAPDTDVTVSGKPAEMGARGLAMYAEVIRMNKGSNRVWIDMPGQMKLPESRSMSLSGLSTDRRPAIVAGAAGQPASVVRPTTITPPDPMIVTWKDSMTFDGLTAVFEHSVDGKSSTRKFQTDVLEVSLRRRIDFAQPRGEDRAEIGRIVCRGGMWMESRSFDPLDPKKLTSIDHMQTRDLMIDETTGAILGQGPGWMTSVRHSTGDPLQPPTALVAQKPATPAAGSTPDGASKRPPGRRKSSGHKGLLAEKSQLSYLNVQFTGALSGDLNRHEITFHDHVRSVYGPVLSWEDELNPDEVDDLGPGGALMLCDQLTVRQTSEKMPGAAPDHKPVELEAIGNASVEGEQFRALGQRITYSEAKTLLILEGDGRREAELYRQERPGEDEARTAARSIYYWRSTNRVEVNGSKFFDLSQPLAPETTPKRQGKK